MRRQNKQLQFLIRGNSGIKHFGGALNKNSNPKTKRPITTKRPLHLVVRSSKAKGPLTLLKKDREINDIIKAQGKKHGVKIYKLANGGNHLHLIVLPCSRQAFHGFIRSITGLVARLVMNVQRGRPLSERFWDQRPFTRIIEWGREYRAVCGYLLQNTLEAMGFIPYKKRIHRYNMNDIIQV